MSLMRPFSLPCGQAWPPIIYLSGHRNDKLPAHVGLMVTQRQGDLIPDDRLWAADNGCFNRPHEYDEDSYLGWLKRWSHVADRCLFATAPDVRPEFSPTPATDTITRSRPTFPKLRDLGYRAALVGQDGMELVELPWGEFDAFFIGGSDDWKLGPARHLVDEAKSRGLWVHAGRVNSYRRLKLMWQWGCDSADGTFVKYAPDHNIGRLERWFEKIERDANDDVKQLDLM